MAQITWQNVNAPDFQGTADSYKTFADLFSNSMNDLNKGVTAFREDQLRSNDNAAIQDALRYQDPGKLRAALSSGALLGGPDNRRDISTGALGKIAGLSRALAEQDELQFRNQDTAFDFGQKVQNTAASNATRAINAQLLAANGNPKLGQQIIQDNMDVIGRAPTTVQNSLLSDFQSANSTGLTNRKSAFNQGNAEQGFEDNQVGQSTAQDIDAKFGDPAAAKAELYRRRESMSPTEWASTGAHLTKIYGVPMIGGVDGTNPGGMTAGIGGATGAIAAAVGSIGSPIPDDAPGSTWAEAKGLTKSESGGNYSAQNNAVGSGGKVGHFGALQFGQDRLTDAKNAGVIPPNMTPEEFMAAGKPVQDKVADWHFKDIDEQSKKNGLEQYYGKTIGGVLINRDAIRGMAHIGGIGGAKAFIESGGKKNPSDGPNGVGGASIADYGKRFGAESPKAAAQARTHDGFPARQNPDGTHSTEITVTVTDPRLNGGKPTNIPSLWGGEEVNEDTAVRKAIESRNTYQSYASIEDAVEAAKAKSARGGANAPAPEFDPLAAREQGDMLKAAAQARLNKNNIDALQPLLAAAEKKGPGTRESVATELAQHPGFSGMPAGWVANRIDEVMKMSPGRISANVAGALLIAGKQGGPEGFWNKAGRGLADWTFGDANQMATSDGGQLNMDLITSEAKKYVPGASAEAMVQQNRDGATLQKLESAEAAYVAAKDKRKAFELAIANGRNLDPRVLDGLRAQEKLAVVEYEKYTKGATAIIREDFNPAAGRADGTKSAPEQRTEKDRKEIDKRLEEIDKQSAGLSRFSMEHTALMAEARRLRAKRSKLSTARKE